MKTRMRVLGTVVCAALMATGCGNLTIRSWVKVITATSTGSIQSPFLGTDPLQFQRLQGGFQGTIVLNTRTLPAPINGTLNVEDVRIGGASEVLGALCVWGNPAIASTGTVHLDILGGSGSANVNLAVKASTGLSDLAGVPPVELEQVATFPLNGVGLTQLLNASSSGSADGLFATSASFEGDTLLFGAPATFALDLDVTNESTPPLFDADVLAGCAAHFDEQGRDLLYAINSKSSYLLASGSDSPAPPLVINLAELGAHPGDTLKLARVGTYDDTLELKDGTLTKVGAVFSSSATVNAANQRNRIPGAIDAGTDVSTGSYLKCIIWPFCSSTPTDITQDFAITSSPTVTIPAGAQYLVVAPIPDSLTWGDNSGFGLGVSVTVNP
jgi:hypothetical protein